MAITYPISVPNHDFAGMTIRMVTSSAISESPFSYAQQVYNFGGERWEAEVKLPPMTLETARQWEAFFLSLQGHKGTFTMGNPLDAEQLGTISPLDDLSIVGNWSAGSRALVLEGAPDGSSIKAGDAFSIGGHIHKVLEDAFFVDGIAVIDITPALRSDVVDGQLAYTHALGTWRLASNDIGWDINNASIYGFTFACVEAL